MAELSTPVDKTEFERSWHSDPTLNRQTKVEFVFVGQTVFGRCAFRFFRAMVVGQFPRDLQRSDTASQPRLQYLLALRERSPKHNLLDYLRLLAFIGEKLGA
jgi:hypothetical protein